MEKYREKAKELLKATKAERLYMNHKGEFFTKEDLAKNSLKKGEKLEIFEATANLETDNGDNASDVMAKIQNTEDADTLYEMLEEEKEGDNNADVVAAIEERIKEFEDAE